MPKELTLIAKRITKQMIALSRAQIDMNMFMGLGCGLAIVYEVATGRDVIKQKIKPQECMQWAIDLPQVPGEEVDLRIEEIPGKMPGSLLV